MEVTPAHRSISVTEASQPSAVRFASKDAAELAGFGEADVYRAGLVATELGTNLVKHAVGGEVLVRVVGRAPAGEIEMLAIDRGPGIADVARSLRDGHSTAGSPGTGLGAARRLSDVFDIYSVRGRGTVVLARLRAGRAADTGRDGFDHAGVSVAMSGEPVCGDAWQVYREDGGLVAIVVDGLGHGIPASDAAAAALAVVDPRRAAGTTALLQAMHAALRSTRGAAASVAAIRPARGVVDFAGVGNVGGVIYGSAAPRHAVALNGTLGHEVRQFREYSYPWENGAVFVMYSDGLVSHWTLDSYPGLRQRHPAVVAAVLYRDFSRQRDDVTVVVARETR